MGFLAGGVPHLHSMFPVQCGSCQTEVYHALQAVLDATSREVLEDAKACSWLVERICDPGGERSRRVSTHKRCRRCLESGTD